MSSTAATPLAFDYNVGPKLVEAKEFTTEEWKSYFGITAKDTYRRLRTSALRLALTPLCLLVVHLIMASYGLPMGLIALATLFAIIPLDYFRRLVSEVSKINSVAGMIELFELTKYDDEVSSISNAEFSELFGELYFSDTKKKKRQKRLESFLSVKAGGKKFFMWVAVLALVAVLAFVTGPFFGLAFACTYLLAIVTTVRYFRAATRPIRWLASTTKTPAQTEVEPDDEDEGLDILNPRTDGEDNPEDKKKGGKKKAKKTAPVASNPTSDSDSVPTDDELRDALARHHAGKSLPEFEGKFLEALFGDKKEFPNGYPTVEEFDALLNESPAPANNAPTAPVASNPTSDDSTGKPPLPRRTAKKTAPARHARRADQTGPTGTPPHGTPVVAASQQQSPAPAPTFSKEDLDEIFIRYMNDEKLSPEEFAAIEPWTKKR